MSYDAIPGRVFVLPENIISETVPQEFKDFMSYADKFNTDLALFACGYESDMDMCTESMQFDDYLSDKYEDCEDEIIEEVEFMEMSRDEWEEACVDTLVERLEALKEAFKEATGGVMINLWCPLGGDESSRYNEIDLENYHWIILNGVTVTPEVAALGVGFDEIEKNFCLFG